MKKTLLCLALAPLCASASDFTGVNLLVNGELQPATETIHLDASRDHCLSGTVSVPFTWFDLTFTLDEECCDWELNSCGSGNVNTVFSGVQGPNISFEGDDDPGICPNTCTGGWSQPDVVNKDHGDSFMPPQNNPPECLPAGVYTVSFGVMNGRDASCQLMTQDIPWEVCFTLCPATADTDDLPSGFELAANAPNPFNPSTTISFRLPETGEASLRVHDLQGREVAVLADGLLSSGEHQLTFDGSNLASGVYLYTLSQGAYSETRKMVLVK